MTLCWADGHYTNVENFELILAADEVECEMVASMAHMTSVLQEADQGARDGGVIAQ